METDSPLLVVRVAEFGGDADGGRRLNDLIRPPLVDGREVELDFLGANALTEPFLEAAVAGLLDEIPFDDLVRRLIVSNMTVRDLQGLRFVLERARPDGPCCEILPVPTGGGTENP